MIIEEYAKPEIKPRLKYLSPAAFLVLCDFIMWCVEKRITPTISGAVSDLDEDQALERVSATHREGRAFDVSVKGWTKEQIDDCVITFSQRWRHLAAIGEDGNPKLVYLHDAGTGFHLHFQVHRRYAMPLVKFN